VTKSTDALASRQVPVAPVHSLRGRLKPVPHQCAISIDVNQEFDVNRVSAQWRWRGGRAVVGAHVEYFSRLIADFASPALDCKFDIYETTHIAIEQQVQT